MKTYYAVVDILALVAIPVFAVLSICTAISGNLLNAILYGICAAIFGILEGISIIQDKIDIYYTEVTLLRADLAELNKEISTAFNKVDNNFRALVGAIDDFAAELEGEEE